MATAPTTVEFPEPLPVERKGKSWRLDVDGVSQAVSNLDKLYWKPEGYTKGDLVTYYFNIAPTILPYLRDRPITMKRMPDGADGPFFYAKQAPEHTPGWMPRATVTSNSGGEGRWGAQSRATIDYLLAQDRPSLVYLANLGCIEMHPWHSRIDRITRPDYAFFDLDPFGVEFATVRAVALVIKTALDQLGLRAYPRTSGSTGIHLYVPIERVHSYGQVREWVNRVCRLVNSADPGRTTMEWKVSDRTGKVFLDAGMNTEGRNIAAVYSLRPERGATVSTPLTWEELEEDVEPQDFTIATIWRRLEQVGDLFPPVIAGGQDLRHAMAALRMDPDAEPEGPGHHIRPEEEEEEPGDLKVYEAKRDFARTPEPPASVPPAEKGNRYVIQHHLATRLHHDLRLERGGTARSWAVPKGLPAVPGVPHLAVQTEDHPLEYLTFEGDIPDGEYGGGPMRIWDSGTYEAPEWVDGKVTFVLHGGRHRGEWHLFRTSRDDAKQWMVTRAAPPEELPPGPPTFAPMLSGTREAPFDDDRWLFEVKWDGVRAIATCQRPGTGEDGRATLITRNGNDCTPAYPELAPVWERVLARNAVLDGEVVALGPDGNPSFQLLAQRMHLRDKGAVDRARRATPVTYMVFDLLAVDGEALVDLPIEERLARLDEVLVPGRAISRSDAIPGVGTALWAAVKQRGMEGIVAKKLGSRYLPGRRSKEWLKIKVRRPGVVVIGGWLPQVRGHLTELGSLLVGAYDGADLVYVGRVGTGFDHAERLRLQALLEPLRSPASPFSGPPGDLPPAHRDLVHWVNPEITAEIEYGEITNDGRLRAPAYKRQCDVAPPQVRRESLR